MRRIYEEIISGGNLGLIDELFAEDVVEHEELGGGHGAAGLRRFFTALRGAFPDYHTEVQDLIAEGDRVVARITAHGTHCGEFLGIPATGKRVAVSGIDIIRFEGGKAV